MSEDGHQVAGAGKIEKATQRIQQQREQQQSNAPTSAHTGKEQTNRRPASSPAMEHHDSGGGSAPLLETGGDNSIAEYGREGSSSEREQAAAAVHGYLDSRIGGHWGASCSYISAPVVASLEQFAAASSTARNLKTCPQILASLSRGQSGPMREQAAEADVLSLRLEGGRGYVLYYGHGHETLMIPVIREAGSWKVGSLEGSPLP